MGRRALAVVAAAFVLGLAAGLSAPTELADQVLQLARELVERVYTEDPYELALRIFLNNARVAALIALLSPLVIVPALLVFANGFVLGVALEHAASRISWATAILAVAPHGVLEIPALLYVAAASTSFGAAFWRRVLGRGGSWLRLLTSLVKPLLTALLLLAVAAFIEAFVTPLLVRLLAGVKLRPA